MRLIFGLLFISCFAMCTSEARKNVEGGVLKNKDGDWVGVVTKSNFVDDSVYQKWFKVVYTGYAVDNAVVEELKTALKGITIKAYMGTWCSDSKREIPRLYKVLEAANFDLGKLKVIGVDRKMKANGLEADLHKDVARVPVIILYRDDVELGRFVEKKVGASQESDLLQIAKETGYKHAYSK